MRKIYFVLFLIIAFFVYNIYSSKVYLDSKVDNVITKFNDNYYQSLKGWYGFNRGDATLWRNNYSGNFYFFYSNQDTNTIEIPIHKDFLLNYGLNVEVDTNITKRLKIVELNNKILDITYGGFKKNKIDFDTGMKSNELFPVKNLINELEEISLIKKELNLVLIQSSPGRGVIQFYLSLDDVLTYSIDGNETFLKNNSDLIDDFKKGKWINKNWHLSKSEHKLDFG